MRNVQTGLLVLLFLSPIGGSAHASGPAVTPCHTQDPGDQMVQVGMWCVDRYDDVVCDATAGSTSAIGATCISDNNGNNGAQSTDSEDGNSLPQAITHDGVILKSGYRAYSKLGFVPTRFVTYYQALAACAAAGKQVLSDQVWVTAELGTSLAPQGSGAPKTRCNIGTSDPVRATGLAGSGPTTTDACISQWGVEDLVGNVWKWTDIPTAFSPGSTAATTPSYSLRGDISPQSHAALSGRWAVGFRCMSPL